jgi:polygalacturonase
MKNKSIAKSSGILIALIVFAVKAYSQVYNISSYGAVSGGSTVNTGAIQSAIEVCHSAGGGTVYVPAGVFLTGTLELKSGVNLYLERGAELKGSPRKADYRPYLVPGYDSSSYGMIYALKAENISITGQGAINGNEEVFFDWNSAKRIDPAGSRYTRQQDAFRAVREGIGDGPVVPNAFRPRQTVILSQCKNVLIRDIQFIKSPFWTLHLADCDGVVVTGAKFWSSMYTPNSDGIHITSCNNVMVSDCDIRTGDDGIAITGFAWHLELPGYSNLRHPAGNITITNCNIQSRSCGLRIGYTDQNSIRNVHVSNVNITNSNRGIGLFIRGEGSIENVTFSNISIETRLHTGDWWGHGEPIHISTARSSPDISLGRIRNVTFRDISCRGENGILVYGSAESVVEDLRFQNIRFTLERSDLNTVAGGNIDLRGDAGEQQLFASGIPGFFVRHVEGLLLDDVALRWGDVREDYFREGLHIKNAQRVALRRVDFQASPANAQLPGILLEDVSLYDTVLPDARMIRVKKLK